MRASPSDVRGEARGQSTKPSSGSRSEVFCFSGATDRRREAVRKRMLLLDTGHLLRRFGCSDRVAEIPARVIPALLGDLERLRAALWRRMTSAPASENGQPEAQGPDARSMNELSPEEVGKRLGLSPRSVHELLRTKRLPGYKVGRLWRVDEADLEAWKERQKAAIDKGGVTVIPSPHGTSHVPRPSPARSKRFKVKSVEIRRAVGHLPADHEAVGGGKNTGQRSRRLGNPVARQTTEGPDEG